MSYTFSSRPASWFWPFLLGLGLVLSAGCDSVPGPRSDALQSPQVSNLRFAVDSTLVSEQDSLATVVLDIAVRAVDPDGTVNRVVFALEPSANPRGTAFGELRAVNEPLYGSRLQLSIPLVKELYTVRVFAIDNDSLASNQVVSQFRFEPGTGAQTLDVGGIARRSQPRFPFPLPAPRSRVSTTLPRLRP